MMDEDKDKTRQGSTSSAPMEGNSAEIMEESSPSQHERWRDLVLDIQSRRLEGDHGDILSPVSKRLRLSPMASPRIGIRQMTPSSSRDRTNVMNLLNFKNRNRSGDVEEGVGLVLDGREKYSYIPRTWSLTNLITPRKSKNTGSLPVTPIAHSNPESMHMIDSATSMKRECELPIRRSRSVPMLINKDASVKSSRILRVIPTPSHVDEDDDDDDGGEDLPEEEAVCRICLVELGEDSEAFRLECMCKGELALAHRTCAVKWFSIKGNRTCDVCKREVKNLPVTLLREARGDRRSRNIEQPRFSEWQDVPILVIVSMLSYFCTLEQLLIIEMKSTAIAVALPFSCIIGILGSMISATMVKKNYVWLFATVQFGFVVLFAHLFYAVVKQPVMCIVLATMIGFGLTMSGTTAINEYLKRRRPLATTQVVPPA